jgi:hypothetical protein
VFVSRDDVPYQRILDPGSARPEVAVTEVAPEELDGALAELAGRAFDLETEVPIRARLFAHRSGPAGKAFGGRLLRWSCRRDEKFPTWFAIQHNAHRE